MPGGRRPRPRPAPVATLGTRREPTVPSSDDEHPVFSLRHLQAGYDLRACTKDEKAALADTLYKLGQLTWAELRLAPRHGVGYEKIAREAIRAPLPTLIGEDTVLLAFRFCALAPMVGFRRGAPFHILWLDRAFTLYKH